MTYSIRDVLWLTLAISLGLGWWCDATLKQREIVRLEDKLTEVSWDALVWFQISQTKGESK